MRNVIKISLNNLQRSRTLGELEANSTHPKLVSFLLSEMKAGTGNKYCWNGTIQLDAMWISFLHGNVTFLVSNRTNQIKCMVQGQ